MRRILCALGMLAVCAPVPAQVSLRCTMSAVGDAAVQRDGVAQPLPASPDDCRALRVTQGQVIACLADAQGEPVCRSFGRGEVITDDAFGPGGRSGALVALDRLLRTGRAGRDRGADPLLPNKTVLLLDGRLLVDFSEPEMQGVESVEIRGDSVDGPLLARAERTAGPAPIPAEGLAVGRSYWAVPVPGRRPTQAPKRFDVAAPGELQTARARLLDFDRQQAGPLATAMMRAAWLARENYEYDALVTLKVVGMRVR